MRCFVTGATGFVGSRVVAALKGAGHDVRVLARDPRKAGKLGLPPESVVPGDLFSTPKIHSALRDCEVVYHLAAEIATQRDPKKLWRVDVEGTDAVLDACEDTGVRRFVFVSTVVVGDPKGRVLCPEEPLVATTAYGRAKLEAEARLRRSKVPFVIVRPSHVYGPGGWFAELVEDFRAGRRYLPGRGHNYWDTVHVDDVVSALILAGERALPGTVLHAADDYPITMREFFNLTADALGLPRPYAIPVFVAKLARGRGPIAAAVRSARSDNSALKALGWKPRWTSAREGIFDAVRELCGPSGAGLAGRV